MRTRQTAWRRFPKRYQWGIPRRRWRSPESDGAVARPAAKQHTRAAYPAPRQAVTANAFATSAGIKIYQSATGSGWGCRQASDRLTSTMKRIKQDHGFKAAGASQIKAFCPSSFKVHQAFFGVMGNRKPGVSSSSPMEMTGQRAWIISSSTIR